MSRFLQILESDPSDVPVAPADDHSALWDAAVAAAEASGEDSPLMDLVDFLAETLNGGVAQFIENSGADAMEKYFTAVAILRARAATMRCAKCLELAQLMRDGREAVASFQRMVTSRDQRDEDPAPHPAFTALESWIYDNANLDPVLKALAGSAVSSNPVPHG